MALDASIYQNIQPAQSPDMLGSAEKAANLSQLMMAADTQRAMREAYAQNTDASGNLNRQGFLSALGRVNPTAAIQYGKQMMEQDKLGAEAKNAQAENYQKQKSLVANAMQQFQKVPDEQKPQEWQNMLHDLATQNVEVSRLPSEYDPQKYAMILHGSNQHIGQTSKDYLADRKTEADIGMVPIQKQAAQFGSRSPNAELTSQYTDQVKPVRSSQMAMNQMIDNYNNPSPQGDASLVLNAFKIKFPNAPDVNSLEELSKSQAASDQWKQVAAHALKGGLDQGTRDNLMRDGISTFRANVDTLKGAQERIRARQSEQGVNDPTLTYEPGIEKTFSKAMELQGKIGPYVPPTERGGFMASVSKGISRLTGADSGSAQKADNDGVAYAAPTGGSISAHDAAALKWLKTADKTSPDAFAVRAKLKQKGLLK